MSLASRSLNSALCATTPTKKKNRDNSTSAVPSAAAVAVPRPPNHGQVEAIKVAVRLKPLSANKDYDEIDPQIGRAWRVISETNTIAQECPAELAVPVGIGGVSGVIGRFGTPSKFGTPGKALGGGGSSSHHGGSQSTFSFDRVFGEESTTGQVYDGMVKDIVHSVTQRGINGTVFAYGQTSSGKTHTMIGNRQPPTSTGTKKSQPGAASGSSTKSIDGVVHMAARDIFDTISDDPSHSYAVRVSFLELYNEECRDLLVAGDRSGNITSNRALAVREDPKRGVFVENLTAHRVYNLETLLHYLNIGEKHKSVAATGMNDRSSRSHTIFRITVERKKRVAAVVTTATKTTMTTTTLIKGGAGAAGMENAGATATATATAAAARSSTRADGVKLVATLNLVDLAGSESVRHTGATGSRQKEGGKINQSLLTLSRVIMGLGKGGKTFVNYRDSKLTRILQSSLSGNARMAVICCATLSDAYTEETKSTLQFASRAKLVKTRAAVNEINEDPSVIKKLQREIAQRSEEGKQALRQLRVLEQSAKDAEKAASDANEKLKKLYDFVRSSDTVHLLPQEHEYGQVLSTRNSSYVSAPSMKATPARPFAKAPPDRRSAMKKQFSESLFVRTSLDGCTKGTNLLQAESSVSSTVESSFVSPRYAGTMSTFNHSSTQVTLLKDALAAKTVQVRNLMEKSRQVDNEALDSMQQEKEALQAKIDGLNSEKNDALDWIEELYSQADKRDNELKENISQKEEALAEIEQLRNEVESLKDMQMKSSGDNERICQDLRAMYEEKNCGLQREVEEANQKLCKEEKSLATAREERNLALERLEKVAAARDEASAATKELLQEKNTLLESLDDLSIENQQALQIIEELTSDKDGLSSEIERLRAEQASTIDTSEKLEQECSRMATEMQDALSIIEGLTEEKVKTQQDKDALQEQLDHVHSMVAGQGQSEASDSTQTLQILEELTGAMETNETLSAECRRMTCENQDLAEQVKHLNSSLKCQSDIARSTEEELYAENQGLRDELAEMGKVAAKASEKVQELSSALDAAQSDADRSRKEHMSSAESLKEVNLRLNQALEENASLAKSAEDLKRDLHEKVEQLNAASALTEGLESEVSSLKQQIDNLNSSLVRQRAEILASTEQEFISRGNVEKQKLMEEKQHILDANTALISKADALETDVKTLSSVLGDTQEKLAAESDEKQALVKEKQHILNTNTALNERLGRFEVDSKAQQEKIIELSSALEDTQDKLAAESDEKKAVVEEKQHILDTNATLIAKADTLETDVKAKQEKIAEMLSDLEDIQEKLAKGNEEKQSILDANSALRAKANRLEMDAKARQEQIANLSADLQDIQEQLASSRAEIDSSGKSETELKTAVSGLSAQKARLQNEIDVLSGKVASSQSELVQLQSLYSEKCEAESTLRVDNSKLQQNVIVATKEVNDLSKALEAARSDLDREKLINSANARAESAANERLSMASVANNELQGQIDVLQGRIEDLSSALEVSKEEINNANAENVEKARALSIAETSLSDMSAENKKLHTELQAMSDKPESARNELKHAESNASAASSTEVDELKTEIKKLSKFVAAKDSEIKTLLARNNRLSLERDDAVKSMVVMRRESTTVQSRAVELENKNTTDQSKVAELTASVDKLSKEKAKLEHEKAKLEKEKVDALRTAKRARRESTSAQSKIKELTRDLEHANTYKREMEDRIRTLEMLVEEADADNDKMMKDRNELLREHAKKCVALMEEKRAAEKQIAHLVRKVDDMVAKMDMLEASKASAEATTARLLEQKNRALTRLDATLEEKSRSIQNIEANKNRELQIAKKQAEQRQRLFEKEKENEIAARETKLDLLEKERNSFGKMAARSIRLVGKEAKHKVEGVRHFRYR